MKHVLIGVVALLFAHPVQAQLAAPNEMGVAFAHVHLSVTDIELHKKLWTELFGGVLVEREGFAAVQVPGTLVFLTEREPTAPSQGTAMDHFGFKVRDIQAVLAAWRTLGYEVDREFTGGEGFPQAYITMPDGARVELQEDSELPVKAEMYHVHFYTPQYRDLLAWYTDLFGATRRTRGSIETTADVPGANLSFSDSEQERTATVDTAVDHIGFEVEDMAAFAKILEGKGVEFDVLPFYIESLDVWVAFFTDPSGVRVEVTEGLDHF